MANENKPYHIYLPDEVVEALDAAAEQTSISAGNKVAIELYSWTGEVVT